MNVFDYIYLDNWNIIFDYCDFLSKIRLRQVCKFLYNNLQIIDFYHIDDKYLDKLTDDILKNYNHIKYLNAYNNSKISDVNWMINLKELNARDNCVINQKGIQNLNLIKLNVRYNSKITDVSMMTLLKELDASDNCGIDQNGIKN